VELVAAIRRAGPVGKSWGFAGSQLVKRKYLSLTRGKFAVLDCLRHEFADSCRRFAPAQVDEMAETSGNSVLSNDDVMRMTSEIVSSFVSNNAVPAENLPDVIRSVYRTVSGLAGAVEAKADDKLKPAVAVSKSVTNDYIVCLEDGRKLKMLKRYLRSRYDMSPDEYRRRWGLAADYPMVAPSYTERRSEFAKKIGLGKGVRKSR
jgi:predicted transcriptional regulator